MSDDIQFGEVRNNPPEQIRSPANDEHFSVARMGETAPDDLPIFVDLDVFLELENHAASNTNVELGGVLLGRQAIDEQGKPLVVISDSLRAEHYEATRGSFKFTHSTWSEITRRRQQMNDSLAIVGWYHTHPGWGVFLSDMDDFICRNFFGRPLDVAMVIDPRQGTRGWFQWNDSNSETRQCAGYFLFSSRHRAVELDATVLEFSGAGNMTARRPSDSQGLRFQPVPSVSGPGFESVGTWAMIWLMGLQTLVLLLVAWRVLAMPLPATTAAAAGDDGLNSEQVARLEAEVRVWRDLTQSMLVRDGLEPSLSEGLVRLRLEAEQLASANVSHVERIAGLEKRLAESNNSNKSLQDANKSLSVKLAEAGQQAKPAVPGLAGLNANGQGDGKDGLNLFQPWLIGIFAVAIVGLGVIMVRLARRAPDAEFEPDDEPDRNRLPDIRMESEPEIGTPTGRQP